MKECESTFHLKNNQKILHSNRITKIKQEKKEIDVNGFNGFCVDLNRNFKGMTKSSNNGESKILCKKKIQERSNLFCRI